MYFKQALILTFLITLNLWMQAQELVIEVTTDKYPAETSWTLFDTDQNVVKTNGTLLKNTTHRDTVQLDETSCYYWTIYDAYGDGMSNSSAPGDYKIYLDGVIVDSCKNPNFGHSISVYGLGSNCVSIDGAMDTLLFSDLQAFNPFDLSFRIINFGSETINSIELRYSIDGIESATTLVSGLSVEFSQMDTLAFPEKLNFSKSGTYRIGVKILKINDVADQNTGNNYLEKTIQVENGYWQKPMHEQFTSSTCLPCAGANAIINPTLAEFPGQYSLIKYQVNFPGSGDPYYTPEVGYMMGLYNVNSAPTFFVDAYGEDVDYTPEDFESHLGKLTQQFITIETSVVGDSMFSSVSMTTTEDLSGIGYLRFAVVEGITYENVATNGEKQFENVFMKFISKKDGTPIGQLKAGADTTLHFATSLAETNIEEFTDLKAVAYLFYKNTYKILQSEMVDIPFSAAPPYITFNIQNGATNVDTLTMVEMVSDKKLFNSDGSEITDINSYLVFKKTNKEGTDVPFNAIISSDKKTISVTPVNALEPNTTYFVALSGVQSQEGVAVTHAEIAFTTVEYVGAYDHLFNDVTVYPNPVNNELNIRSSGPTKVSVSDLMGRILVNNFDGATNIQLNFSDYSAGIYLVHITIGTEQKVYKIIKR